MEEIEEQPLATVDQLAERLPFVMDDDDRREAEGALEELSDEARYYGSARWLTEGLTPRPVRVLVLKAAKRHMRNYEGYVISRAGDEALTWADLKDEMGNASFTKDERTRLREMAGGHMPGLVSVNTFAHQRRERREPKVVPVTGPYTAKPFPYPGADW